MVLKKNGNMKVSNNIAVLPCKYATCPKVEPVQDEWHCLGRPTNAGVATHIRYCSAPAGSSSLADLNPTRGIERIVAHFSWCVPVGHLSELQYFPLAVLYTFRVAHPVYSRYGKNVRWHDPSVCNTSVDNPYIHKALHSLLRTWSYADRGAILHWNSLVWSVVRRQSKHRYGWPQYYYHPWSHVDKCAERSCRMILWLLIYSCGL